MSGLASVPSIWASVDDRRAAADDLAYHQMEAACSSPTPNQTGTPPDIASYIADIRAWVASVAARHDVAYHHTEAACSSPTPSVGARHDVAYHHTEAACSSPTPNRTRRTPPKPNRPPPWDFLRIALLSFGTFSGIIFTVAPFVWRFAYHDPSMQQNTWAMILLASTGLMMIAAGFVFTSDDCWQR